MAALVQGRTELGVKEFGRTTTIPQDPRARLMYYLDCMSVVLDLSNQSDMTKLRDFAAYYTLSDDELDALVSVCFLLSPDKLNGKVIFQDDDMCGDGNNNFFEISSVRRNLLLTENIIIGGQQTRITKIMAYKEQWMNTNWVQPMQHFAGRLALIATRGSGAAASSPATLAIEYPESASSYHSNHTSSGCCCTIL